MGLTEALFYISAFFAIWGITAGLVWSIDNWVVAPLRGKPFIPKEFWQ